MHRENPYGTRIVERAPARLFSSMDVSRRVPLCAGYVVLHTVAHISAFWFSVTPGGTMSIWYPPVGLALALMVLLGPRMAWLVFLTNFATAWIMPPPVIPWVPVVFPAVITLCYGLSAWAVRRATGSRLLPGPGRSTPVFLLAMTLPPLASALICTTIIDLTGLAGQRLTVEQFALSVFNWWLGDMSGLLVVVPLAIVFAAPWLAGERASGRGGRDSAREAAWAAVRGAFLVGVIVLVVMVPVLRDHSAFYLCFLPLIWICMRHGLRGATLATVLVMMTGLVCMRLAGTTREFSYIFLLFEVAVAVVGLGLGSLVTRREEAERELAANRERLDRVIGGARLGVWEREIATGKMTGNARLAEILGYAAKELEPLEQRILELLHPEDRLAARDAWLDHLEGRRDLFESEVRLRAKDGRWRWVQSRGSIVTRDEEGRPLRVSGTQLDVTDRKRAEEAVARLSGILEASPDFVLTVDAQGRVLYANAALLAWTGRAGTKVADAALSLETLFPAEMAARWRDEAMPAARETGAWQGEGALTDAAGRAVPTSQVAIARPDPGTRELSFSFILRDISDQRRAEEERLQRDRELQQLQKAESLSVLAGGIAHDFNNLLTAILGNANLARLDLARDARGLAHLDNIEQAAGRAARLCQQMLAYAGRTPVAFAEIDLRRLVRDVWRLLESSVGGRVRVRFDETAPAEPILAADIQMQQVAMNLILNAAEAIGDGEGVITVRMRSERMDTMRAAELCPGRTAPAGDYTLREVEDTGGGMSPEVQARIFEPFFTTKFTGQGLGLAAVAGVVKSHRGHIAVRSTPGEGTLFRLAFPARRGSAEPAREAAPGGPARRGSGLVLLVDDEELIREVGTALLAEIGFRAIVAQDGAEGVDRFRENAGELRAVLLDLTMPRMDGFEAHAEMHRINPRVPVVLMSGFSGKLENLPPEAVHPAGVLPKPFGMERLRERLAAVMEG